MSKLRRILWGVPKPAPVEVWRFVPTAEWDRLVAELGDPKQVWA